MVAGIIQLAHYITVVGSESVELYYFLLKTNRARKKVPEMTLQSLSLGWYSLVVCQGFTKGFFRGIRRRAGTAAASTVPEINWASSESPVRLTCIPC